LKTEFRSLSGRGPATAQQFLVDDEKVCAVAGGKERTAESEAVDLALDPELAAFAPAFSGVKRQTRNHPAQAVWRALQHRVKSFDGRFSGGHQR
jgi:hypothetical protein